MTDTITTELRESMVDDARGLLYIGETAFADLCDAIDAVHANLEAENESLRRELDRVLGEQEDRDGWVRLPADANGETIRLGDDMETLLVGHEGEHSRVEWISLTADGWEVDGEPPTSMLHYHAPTVEDVLREFYSRYCTTKPKEEDDAILAEYAAKLRLAGDGA